MRRTLVALVVLVLAAPLALAAGNAQEEAARLESMHTELEQRREAMKDLDNEKRSLVGSIGELDESLARLTDESDAAKKKLEALRGELATLESRAGLDDKALGEAKDRLESRMRALYVGGEGGTARALLGAEGFEELALRRRFLQRLAESDGKLVDEVARTEQAVRDHRERLRQATTEAEMTTRMIEEQRALIAATRVEREQAIARISTEKDLAARQAKDLEERRGQLAVLVAKLVEESHRRPLTQSLGRKGILAKGRLPWPTEGTIIRKFGIMVDQDKAELVSNGVEIRADEGAPVAAVADGRVVHVGWMRGFGRVVIIDHGDGHHTISAHLQKPAVARGDDVKRGQTIGFVGDTESMNGPKLYFELRENGRPRDPGPYLK